MKTITFNDLLEKINGDHSSIILLNALEPSPVRKYQIPNSLNIYQENEILERLHKHKDDEIVVYCTDSVCNKSIALYYLLEHLGYKNVARYAGGLKDWVSHGQALEEILTSVAA